MHRIDGIAILGGRSDEDQVAVAGDETLHAAVEKMQRGASCRSDFESAEALTTLPEPGLKGTLIIRIPKKWDDDHPTCILVRALRLRLAFIAERESSPEWAAIELLKSVGVPVP